MPFLSVLGATCAGVLVTLLAQYLGRKLWVSVAGGILTFLGFAFLMYIAMPTVSFWMGSWFGYSLAAICIGALVGAIGGGLFWDDGSREQEGVLSRFVRFGTVVGISFVAFVIFAAVTTWPMFHSSDYQKLITVEQRVFTEDVAIVDPDHIRLVPWETACTKADKVLGQSMSGDVLGSQLEIDYTSAAIQEINGSEWWIFPLDYRSFWKWQARDSIPGYIKVSAHDPQQEALLVTQDPTTGQLFAMVYTPGAYFSDNLDRKVYSEMPSYGRLERNIEVDESGKPYYVYSLIEPTIGFNGHVTSGVAVADPQSGEVVVYMSDTEIPAWIDRVKPSTLALSQTDAWGSYQDGWVNSWLGQRNVKEATGNDVWFVRKDGRNYWFSGITSVSTADQSLVGLIFVDTRTTGTGSHAIFYEMSGGNEDAAMNAVNAKLGADHMQWHADAPIPYNIHGRPTYIVPVVSSKTHFAERIGIVDVQEVNFVTVAEDLESALRQHAHLLQSRGNAVAPSLENDLATFGPSQVLRVSDVVTEGSTLRYLWLEGAPNQLFSFVPGGPNMLPGIIVVPGDAVTVRYSETTEAIVPVVDISVMGINLRSSDEQQATDARVAKVDEAQAEVQEPRQAEQEFKQLSPDQQRQVLEQMRQGADN